MQIACWAMPWFRALRAVALVLTVVLGLEWTVPLGGYAESNTAPAPRVGNQDLPRMHEASLPVPSTAMDSASACAWMPAMLLARTLTTPGT